MRIVVFALLEYFETNISRAASNIEHSEWKQFVCELVIFIKHSSLFYWSNLLYEIVFPNSVYAKGHRVIHHVILFSDAAKNTPNELLFLIVLDIFETKVNLLVAAKSAHACHSFYLTEIP